MRQSRRTVSVAPFGAKHKVRSPRVFIRGYARPPLRGWFSALSFLHTRLVNVADRSSTLWVSQQTMLVIDRRADLLTSLPTSDLATFNESAISLPTEQEPSSHRPLDPSARRDGRDGRRRRRCRRCLQPPVQRRSPPSSRLPTTTTRRRARSTPPQNRWQDFRRSHPREEGSPWPLPPRETNRSPTWERRRRRADKRRRCLSLTLVEATAASSPILKSRSRLAAKSEHRFEAIEILFVRVEDEVAHSVDEVA
jgi:hypothetical protein